jgi:hypothetical protein
MVSSKKKGILSERDRVVRRRFCRKVKKFMKLNASFGRMKCRSIWMVYRLYTGSI